MMFCLLIRQLSVFLTVFKWYHRCIRVSLVAVFSTVLMHNLDVLLALTLRFDDLLLNWICLLHFVYLWNRIHVCHVVMKCFMQAEAYCSPPVSQSIQTCRRRCIVLDLSVHQSRLAGGGVLFSTCQSVYPDLQAEVYCSPPVSPPVQTCRQRCIVLDLSVHQARLAGGGVLFSTCQSVSQSVSSFVCSFVYYQTCEHDVSQTNEPVLVQIGSNGPHWRSWKNQLWGEEVKGQGQNTKVYFVKIIQELPNKFNQTWQAHITVNACCVITTQQI